MPGIKKPPKYKYRPSYKRAVKSWLHHKITRRGTALRRPIRSTFKAKAYLTRIPAFGQTAYTHAGLRDIARRLGIK